MKRTVSVLVALAIFHSTSVLCAELDSKWRVGLGVRHMWFSGGYDFGFLDSGPGVDLNVGYRVINGVVVALEISTEAVDLSDSFRGEELFAWWIGPSDSAQLYTALVFLRAGLDGEVKTGIYLDLGLGVTYLDFDLPDDRISGSGTVGVAGVGYSFELVSEVRALLELRGMLLNASPNTISSRGLRIGFERDF